VTASAFDCEPPPRTSSFAASPCKAFSGGGNCAPMVASRHVPFADISCNGTCCCLRTGLLDPRPKRMSRCRRAYVIRRCTSGSRLAPMASGLVYSCSNGRVVGKLLCLLGAIHANFTDGPNPKVTILAAPLPEQCSEYDPLASNNANRP
jgi:hypothetical protein